MKFLLHTSSELETDQTWMDNSEVTTRPLLDFQAEARELMRFMYRGVPSGTVEEFLKLLGASYATFSRTAVQLHSRQTKDIPPTE
jgi:hypothetical protein